jgi:hypothetical protein
VELSPDGAVPVPEPTALDAFAAGAANLSAVLATVTETEFDRPIRRVPWTARALLAHLGTAAERVIAMLAEPAPPVVELAVHGLDLADALDRPPWTHDSAVEVVSRLLLPGTVRPGRDAGLGPNDRAALSCRAQPPNIW